jgi:hypothetical protein
MPQTKSKPGIGLDGCFERRHRITVGGIEKWFLMPRGSYGVPLSGNVKRLRGSWIRPPDEPERPRWNMMPGGIAGWLPDRRNVVQRPCAVSACNGVPARKCWGCTVDRPRSRSPIWALGVSKMRPKRGVARCTPKAFRRSDRLSERRGDRSLLAVAVNWFSAYREPHGGRIDNEPVPMKALSLPRPWNRFFRLGFAS